MRIADTASELLLNIYSDLPLNNGGPSYTCEQVANAMESEAIRPRIFTPADRRPRVQTDVHVHAVVPRWARKVPFKTAQAVSRLLCARNLLQSCQADPGSSVAYLWGDVPAWLVTELARSRTFIAREKYNSARLVARDILKSEYSKLDAMSAFPYHQYTSKQIHLEMESLRIANLVFCPSPMVAWSLQEVGLARDALVETSYGFDPRRLDGSTKALAPVEGLTYLFAGSICVRKGAHILLDAWRRANVKGRLVLVGRMEPLIAARYAEILERADVEHHEFTNDIGSFYRSADLFVFPSLEEGSPLVTYEAAYCGLPCLVSPMGAGPIIRDGIEGRVIDSTDVDVWAEALSKAAKDSGWLATSGQAGHERSKNYFWEPVGQQRSRDLLHRLGS